ncbi:MAG TPA: hypothetical protein VFU58_03135, partial [Candidatus Nitrosotalea sp.]|nr:hypothetical protein [Candidatus Nitrosotalea sp.]
MIPIILVSKFMLLVVIDILPFKGSTLSLLVIALIAVIALAIFRFLVPLIIAGIIAILLLVLI